MIGIGITVGSNKPSGGVSNPTVVLTGPTKFTGSVVVTATYSEPMLDVSFSFGATNDLIMTSGTITGFSAVSTTVYEWTLEGDKGSLICYVPADSSESTATGLLNLESNTFEATEV